MEYSHKNIESLLNIQNLYNVINQLYFNLKKLKTSQKGFPWQSREIKIKIKIKLKLRLRLRYHAPVAGGMGLIPDQKTKLLYASWCGQKTSQKKESYISKTLADTLMMVHST